MAFLILFISLSLAASLAFLFGPFLRRLSSEEESLSELLDFDPSELDGELELPELEEHSSESLLGNLGLLGGAGGEPDELVVALNQPPFGIWESGRINLVFSSFCLLDDFLALAFFDAPSCLSAFT
ncbi:hypothetical protein R3P38DRAFT_2786618 [Favolaschia claudopus]|uniref:Secreted protein n=1 Tax=Favolaschia claudopus TaxID=2862362 RepID=A0AAW0AS41_9AGAR